MKHKLTGGLIAEASPIVRASLVLVAAKAGYLLAVLIALLLFSNSDFPKLSVAMLHWPLEGQPTLATHLATWDGAHYLYLSDEGYSAGVHSCAFYPLFPLLVRWFSHLTGGSHLVAGVILGNLFSLGAFVVFWEMVRQRCDGGMVGTDTTSPGAPRPERHTSVSKLALALLLVFPGSLFFQFIYTEGLFLLLVMLLWRGLERRRYGLAWVGAFLLPLTRAVGLFSIVPIGWHLLTEASPAWIQNLVQGRRWLNKLGFGVEVSASSASAFSSPGRGAISVGPDQHSAVELSTSHLRWCLLLAPLLGWSCYVALMWHWTGNPFEGFEAQKHWGVHSISNLWDLPKFLIGLFTPTEWHEFQGSVLDRCVFILLGYCLPSIWQLDRSRSLFVWVCVLGILPAMSGTFTSYTRFASCAFPMFLALAVFLAPSERRHLRWATLALFATLHVMLLWRYVNFRWAG